MTTSMPWTFFDLFSQTPAQFTHVEIPIIQRDYAQGRVSAGEVRGGFLDKLHGALQKRLDEEGRRPLDLDFVYGSVVQRDVAVMIPLDGQQRLTTLFLLHWYLACRDGRLGDFQGKLQHDRGPRFTYKVRQSSKDFFGCLIHQPFTLPAIEGNPEPGSPREALVDQHWFFRAWLQDPTVDSALRMLDAIHEKFWKAPGYYEKLLFTEPPFITFQFLPLHRFGLTDDLYLKMNARGKQLTAFEVFKASLKQRIRKRLDAQEPRKDFKGRAIRLSEYFGHQMDTRWANLFWNSEEPAPEQFDLGIMNFIRGLARVRDPRGLSGQERAKFEGAIKVLADHEVPFTYALFKEHGCLTNRFLKDLFTLLDLISRDPEQRPRGADHEQVIHLPGCPYFDERTLFKQIIHPDQGRVNQPRITQAQWVVFCAYAGYLVKHAPEVDPDHLGNWMRLIRNLAQNSTFGGPEEFRQYLEETYRLLDELGDQDVRDYLLSHGLKIRRFLGHQVREERFKARLEEAYPGWEAIIREAEEHPYFRGQLEFLFAFCGIDKAHLRDDAPISWKPEEDEVFRQGFRDYRDLAFPLFNAAGAVHGKPDFLLARALLCMGDYLPHAQPNYCFPDTASWYSWRRFLRAADRDGEDLHGQRDIFQQLLLELKKGRSLQGVVDDFPGPGDQHDQDRWRRLIVHFPEAIKYCSYREIRFMGEGEGPPVFLMFKHQLNGHHVELEAYHLYKTTLGPAVMTGMLPPFDPELSRYEQVYHNERKPHIRLVTKDLYLEISFDGRRHELRARRPEEPLTSGVVEVLESVLGFAAHGDGTWRRTVAPGGVLHEIERIAAVLAERRG